MLCQLFLSGNERPYDQHNRNHTKIIDHFLLIMIVWDYDYVALICSRDVKNIST